MGMIAPNPHILHYLVWQYLLRFSSFLFALAFTGTPLGRKKRAGYLYSSENVFTSNLSSYRVRGGVTKGLLTDAAKLKGAVLHRRVVNTPEAELCFRRKDGSRPCCNRDCAALDEVTFAPVRFAAQPTHPAVGFSANIQKC